MPKTSQGWSIGGKSADAMGKVHKGSFCAQRYRNKSSGSLEGRWWGGKIARLGRKTIFRSYWYYTVKWRAKSRSLRGKRRQVAKRKARRFYALYNTTANSNVFGRASAKSCYWLDSRKFNLKGAVALAVRSRGQSTRSRARISTGPTGLQYLSVGANGDMRDAVTTLSGIPGYQPDNPNFSVPKRIWTAPNGKLYAFWDFPTLLAASAGIGPCTFAEIDPGSNATNCIENRRQISFGSEYGPYDPGAEPVQFDATGRVYYIFHDFQGTRALVGLRRLELNGSKTDLINDFQRINRWRVLGNGTVVISGNNLTDNGSMGLSWLRRIDSGNNNRDLFDINPEYDDAQWLQDYPDGNLYFPFKGELRRFEPTLDKVTPHDDSDYWTQFPNQTTDRLMYSFRRSFGGKSRQFGVFGDRWSANGGSLQLLQTYPAYRTYPTGLGRVDLVAPVAGSYAMLSGTRNANGNDFETTLLNLESGDERTVIEYTPDTKLDVYHLIDRGNGTVLFDALRFSDNKYIVGEIDVQTGSSRVLNSVEGKLVDLISLGAGE